MKEEPVVFNKTNTRKGALSKLAGKVPGRQQCFYQDTVFLRIKM